MLLEAARRELHQVEARMSALDRQQRDLEQTRQGLQAKRDKLLAQVAYLSDRTVAHRQN
jgi:hypothetical protein